MIAILGYSIFNLLPRGVVPWARTMAYKLEVAILNSLSGGLFIQIKAWLSAGEGWDFTFSKNNRFVEEKEAVHPCQQINK